MASRTAYVTEPCSYLVFERLAQLIAHRAKAQQAAVADRTSEVAAMIEGVLRHCTSAEVERNYVDTHGASVVGFAFSHLLGFKLLPRLKHIGSARLYPPGTGGDWSWPVLGPVLSARAIDWDLVARQYDQMVKYATAFRLGTAEVEQVHGACKWWRTGTAPTLRSPTGKASLLALTGSTRRCPCWRST
jgi:hypothetical protein